MDIGRPSRLSTRSLARAAALHPKRTIGIWVVLIVIAAVLNSAFGADVLTNEFTFTNNPEAQRAEQLLEERLRGPQMLTEAVVVQSSTLTVSDPAFKERVDSLFEEIAGSAGVDLVLGPYMPGGEGLASADGHTAVIQFFLGGTVDEATDNIEPIFEHIVAENGKEGFFVGIVGEASAAFESNELAVSDIEQGERFGVPTALIILLALFGAVLAAIIPLALAAVSIIVALGAVALIGQVFELVFFVTLMITMIGLAVGIDYSLIVVSRYREELARGRSKLDAIEVTGATASRTVLFSGLTVVLALLGMFLIPTTIYRSLGAGAILVVIAAVMVTLTLLPAVLFLMGRKVNALRLPLIGRNVGLSVDRPHGGFWNTVTRWVMRYPVLSLVLAGGLMVAAAVPYTDIKTGFNGVDALPEGAHVREAFLVLERDLSYGVVSPAEVVVDGDVTSPEVLAAVERVRDAVRGNPAFSGESTVRTNPAGDLLLISIPVAGEPASEPAVAAVRDLREEVIPAAFAGVPVEVLVGGITAFNMDFFDLTDVYTPIVFAFVLGLSFVLLTVAFRSVVIPIKSIVLNLLSVGAAYGLMVAVFQKGWGADLLGFQTAETIESWIPLFLFSVLFGLSMDYHVFLLSRIRERFDQTQENTESVAYGLRNTAGLITGAALIMVAVFSGFASGDTVGNQQVGFGLAVAIFLDATVVRSVLVPASMRLLGRANWYFPRFLEWVPRIGIEAQEDPAPAPAGASD